MLRALYVKKKISNNKLILFDITIKRFEKKTAFRSGTPPVFQSMLIRPGFSMNIIYSMFQGINKLPLTKLSGKIFNHKNSFFKFLGKNLHLVSCATMCAKSEVMITNLFIFAFSLNTSKNLRII